MKTLPAELEDAKQHKTPSFFSFSSTRFQLILLLSTSMVVGNLTRGSFGMAMVCMIAKNETATIVSQSNKSIPVIHNDDVCVANNAFQPSPIPRKQYTKTYQVYWSASEQSTIHTAFYIGSLTAVLLLDWIIARHTAKHIIAAALFVCSIGSLLMPFLIILLPHFTVAALIRLFIGLGNGLNFPCANVMISQWFPVQEKSTAMAIYTTGGQLGISLAIFATARSCELSFGGGWPVSFVAYGFIGFFYIALWLLLSEDKPRESTRISQRELEYITGKNASRSRAATTKPPTPYRKILLSPCILSMCLCGFSNAFVMVGLMTYLPQYYKQSMKMDLSNNGIWSSAPFAVQIVARFVFATFADKLKKRKFGVNCVTKTFNGIGMFGTAACIFSISFLTCENANLAVFLMCLCMGMSSAIVPGYLTSIVSVAPMYTSTVSSLVVIFYQTASALSPLLIGSLTKNGTPAEWKMVFCVLSAAPVVAGIAFQLFGSAHPLPWAVASSNRPSIHRSTDLEDPEELNLLKKPKKVSHQEEVTSIPLDGNNENNENEETEEEVEEEKEGEETTAIVNKS